MKKLKITYDMGDRNPREWDNLTKMVCFHKRYRLGDKHNYNQNDYNSWKELEKAIIEKENPYMIKPLYLLDHSGLVISITSFYNTWDSGQIGFVYIPRTKENEGFEKLNQEELLDIIEKDVNFYSNYLEGNVFSYRIFEIKKCECCGATKETLIDSCYGFIGDDWNALMLMMMDCVDNDYVYLFQEKEPWDLDENE